MTAAVLRIILFLLPLVLYLMWRRHAQHRAEAQAEGDQETLDQLQTQFMWVVIGLVALFGAIAVSLAFTSGSEPGKVYVPPHMEDGKVVPGTFK